MSEEVTTYTLIPFKCDLRHDKAIVVDYLRADLIGLWGTLLESGTDKQTLQELDNAIKALKTLSSIVEDQEKEIKELRNKLNR